MDWVGGGDLTDKLHSVIALGDPRLTGTPDESHIPVLVSLARGETFKA